MSSQTKSHSELFGLEGQSKPSHTAGSGPGSGVLGTSGHAGTHNSVSAESGANTGMLSTESKTAGIAEGDGSASRPGAGSTMSKPSQGSGNVGQ